MAQNLTVRRVSVEFTRPADTTAYTAQDGVSNATSAASILTFVSNHADDTQGRSLQNGASYQIKSAKLTKSTNSTTNASFDLYVFTSGVVATNDNSENGMLYINKHVRVGKIAFTLATAGTTNSTCAEQVVTDVNHTFKAIKGNIFGQLVATGAYTPGSAEIFFIELELLLINE